MEKRKRKNSDVPIAQGGLLGAVLSGILGVLAGVLRISAMAAVWSARQTGRFLSWSWTQTVNVVRASFRFTGSAIVWTWTLPGRIWRAWRGNRPEKPEAIRLIERRYSRRFRYLTHIIIYGMAQIIAWANYFSYMNFISEDSQTIYRTLYQTPLTFTLVWGAILLLHTLKYYNDDARDRAIQEEMGRSGDWSQKPKRTRTYEEETIIEDAPYRDTERVLRLTDDGELVGMDEGDWSPPQNGRTQG